MSKGLKVLRPEDLKTLSARAPSLTLHRPRCVMMKSVRGSNHFGHLYLFTGCHTPFPPFHHRKDLTIIMIPTTLESVTELYQQALIAHRNASGTGVNAVLDLCVVLTDARKNLSKTDWQYFTRQHDLTGTKANVTRLKVMLALGKAEPLLRPHAHSLPATLTALKHAARLSAARLGAAIEQGLVTPLSSAEDLKLLIVDTRTKTDPASSKATTGPADYSVTLHWFHAEWTPAKGRAVKRTLDAFLAANATALGLQRDVTWSVDADLSMLTDDRTTAAA